MPGVVPGVAAPQADETKISVSRGLAAWLTKNKTSFAMTSYQSGRLFLVGTMPDGTVSVHQQAFSRAMGVCWDRNGLWLASQGPDLAPREYPARRDWWPRAASTSLLCRARRSSPATSTFTNSRSTAEGRPVFVNTYYSCLATLDPVHSFRPIWKPSFISELAREDRCHMNGLGMLDGKPKYVTAVSQTDVAERLAWPSLPEGRHHRRRDRSGRDRPAADAAFAPGCVRTAALSLSIAAEGFLVEVDKDTGQLRHVAFCPGFLRGLAIVNGFALVTVSKPRYGTFEAMPIADEMLARNATPICGILIIDLASGETVEWLRLEGDVHELFTVDIDAGDPLSNGGRPGDRGIPRVHYVQPGSPAALGRRSLRFGFAPVSARMGSPSAPSPI